jgi:hypothetical protein
MERNLDLVDLARDLEKSLDALPDEQKAQALSSLGKTINARAAMASHKQVKVTIENAKGAKKKRSNEEQEWSP